MTQEQVAHLCKLSSVLPQRGNQQIMDLLKSYYLMKCKEITKSRDLPVKYFSPAVRCSHCYMEWGRRTDVKIRPINLSKRQRRRIRSLKVTRKMNIARIKNKKRLLNSNKMIQTCTFCKHSRVKSLLKPEKKLFKEISLKENTNANKKDTNNEPKSMKKDTKKPIQDVKRNTVNVYCSAKEVFSLSNKDNILHSAVKEPKKVIKNNKKKKDKFAGLCEKAVLAAVKLKQEKEKDRMNDKLNLFLKPSTG